MTDKQVPKSTKEVEAVVAKRYGKGALVRLDDTATEPIPVIPTGSLALDRALGVGGYPRGRVVEVFGPESSGKTTLTLHAIAEAQRAGGTAAFIDAEHAFDARYARSIGVDLASLLVSQPDYGEQALEIALLLAASAAVDLVVVDSVAALVPKSELEGDMGDPQMGLQARLMSQAMRKISGVLDRTDTTILFINQLRQKIGVVFGSPETTTGGQALKYYASVRLDVRRIGKVTVAEKTIGNRTRVRVVKNKVAPPFGEAEFDVRWGTGIDAPGDLLDVAVELGAIQKNGAHFAFGDRTLGHGRERAREALAAHPELYDTLRAAALGKRAAAPPHAA